MKPGDLSTSAAKLQKSWKKLHARWEATKEQWHDPVSQQFEETYLATLEPQIVATLGRMRSLEAALSAARSDCES
jgi:hypothetical protein